MDKPQLLVIAGPNGSGKSTLTKVLRTDPSFPAAYVNADDIVRARFRWIPIRPLREWLGAVVATRRRLAFVKAGTAFAFETVLSTPGKLAILEAARNAGYRVVVMFVTTEGAAINQARVKARADQGGHDVNPAKVEQRYGRAMRLLPCLFDASDEIYTFDNSPEGEDPAAMISSDDGNLTVPDGLLPGWAADLATTLADRATSRQSMDAILAKRGISGQPARLGAQAEYVGEILGLSKEHAAQNDTGRHIGVIHDRRIGAVPTDATTGQTLRIRYRLAQGGKLRQ